MASSKQTHLHQNGTCTNTQPIVIDGVQLPILENSDTIEQPFLALPKELTAYHRSIVHDLCTDTLQLFHCGVDGMNEGDRFVAVSIYSDGLNFVPGLEATDRIIPVALHVGKYRPWIMKKNLDTMSKTEDGKKNIWEMIDQPGRCLRDAHDTIALIEMQGDNLSTIEPPEVGDTTCMLVDSAGQMRQCIRELEDNKPTEIAFDIECYNKGKYQQITCLIQLATNDGREYVIDVLGGKNDEVWEEVHGLAKIFEDRTVIKIGHGIRGLDVQSLQRDFGIFVVNAFDTYEAANVLQLKEKGLAKICSHYGLQNSELYNDLKRKYQATDWMQRPLTKDMILYGRYDVHYLISLRRLMMRDLICHSEQGDEIFYAKDLRMNLKLMQVISKSQDNCLKLWNTKPESYLENKHFQFLAKQRKKDGADLTKSQLNLYAKLASWREAVAKEEEVLAGTICALNYLARVAVHRPATEDGLRQIRDDIPPILIKYDGQNMSVILGLVEDSLVEDNVVSKEYPAYQKLVQGLPKNKMMEVSTRKEDSANESNNKSRIISSPMFWAVTCATMSAVICSLIADKKRKGCRL